MFRDAQSMLEYEARKNPPLAALIADIPNLTEDQIRSHPMRLMPWMRQALLKLREKIDFTATYRRVAVQIENYIVDGHVADPKGETRRWVGANEFIKLHRGHLEITYGELVWFDTKGGVWIDSIYCQPFDPKLLTYTQSVGEMSRLAYMDALRDRARGQAMPSDPVLAGLSNPAATSPMAGVSFYRP